MQKARNAFLSHIKPGSRILILGEGPGSFLKELILSTSDLEIDVVESSEMMRKQAMKKILHLNTTIIKVEFFFSLKSLIQNIPPEQRHYDVVVTHFFLDMFSGAQLNQLITQVSRLLKESGYWIYSDFSNENPKSSFHKLKHRCLLWIMYKFFKYTCGLKCQYLVSTKMFFQNARLKAVQEEWFYSGFITSKLYQLSSSD